MNIQHKLAEQGSFLFRWRSFVPLALLFPAVMAFSETAAIEYRYGDFIDEMWVVVGLVVSMIGLAIRWVTVGFVPAGTSGRNTKSQRAEVLNTDGMYSIVKNPLYLGNFLAILGVLISLKVWWLILIGSLSFWIYIERVISVEESYLTEKFGAVYKEWASKTPIFIPDFKLWKKTSMPFSWKTVLKREYNGLMGVCSAFFLTELIVDVFVEGEAFRSWLAEDWPWVWGFVFGAIVFLTLRTLKKHTSVLVVEGR